MVLVMAPADDYCAHSQGPLPGLHRRVPRGNAEPRGTFSLSGSVRKPEALQKDQTSRVRRPENARPKVTSSAYSKSPPTGSPLASRVTVSPIGLTSRAR